MPATTAMLTFLTPVWAVAGLAAVGLPLLAHLLSRTRHRPVLFPTMRFVEKAALETSRIERPRHRLLMLLRWLLLLLVVVAFMQPRWQPEATAGNASGRGVTAVILLDASASMRRTADGASLFDRAKRLADEQLDELDPSRDTATVLRVGRLAQPLLPEPTANLGLLRARLAGLTCGYQAADWAAALTECVRAAQSSGRAVRVIVISDQQGDWPGDAALGYAGLLGPIHYVRIDGPTANTALRLIDLRPYPPVAGRAVDATAELRQFGAEPRRVTLSATIGGEQRQQALTLDPGAVMRLDLRLIAPTPGPAVLRLAIDDGDPMPLDDSTGAFVQVLDGSSVLIVRGDTADERALADRLALVISPGGSPMLNTPSVRHTTADEAMTALATTDPSRLRTAVLLPGVRVDAALADALKAYLGRGGGVVWLNDLAGGIGDDASSLLPFVADRNSSTDRSAPPARAVNLNFDHDALRLFEGPARAGLASLAWPGVDEAGLIDRAELLLTTADTRPIIAALGVGRGRVVALNTDLPTGAGGPLAEPAFVVLFNELCRYASPGLAPPPPMYPGRPIPPALLNTAALDRPDDADPSGERFDAPGPYLALDAAQRPVDGVWVDLDPAESDPRTGRGWSERTDGSALSGPVATDQANAPLSLRPDTIDLWPYLALGAVLLAGAESGLLWRFAGGRSA